MFCKANVFRKLIKAKSGRGQDEWNDVTAHWSNPFAWEEINFHHNRTEPRHDSMWNFCAAAQIEFQLQGKTMPQHDFGPLY